MNKKYGFTLSEVIVAIGVLGVLSALLIPAIMSNTPDNNRVMFKKAYFNLERAVYEMINDDINYPAVTTWGSNNCLLGTTPVNCGFNNTATTTNGTNNKFCYFLAEKLNVIGTANCGATNPANPSFWNFITTDGIRWKFYLETTPFAISETNYNYKIVMDVNGAKGPNCANTFVGIKIKGGAAACTGSQTPDIHEVGIRYDGKIKIDTNDTSGIDILTNPTDNQK